jgi:SAM-dependent methyltransferase
MTIATEPTPDVSAEAFLSTNVDVMLADGEWHSLAGLTPQQLSELQWEQEQRFAKAIAALPKQSRERSLVTGQAYDTICTILAAQRDQSEPLVMGLDKRYTRLVLDLLNKQINRGIGRPRLFEVGYGSGMLLKEISEYGFPTSGVEISTTMRDQAVQLLGSRHEKHLLLGDLREVGLDDLNERPTLIYWNDVFEHICPDEIGDYLAHIHHLLQPGGMLVTITPNWLLRPSDVTRSFCPLRTEARGLHFKEYRLAEVTKLLKQAGFRRVATPLVVSKKRIYLCASGLRFAKQCFEPLIDKLPIKPAHLLCRGLGLSYTIATK